MGAPENNSPPPPDAMQRVKVYRLNDDGKWDDQGTGHVNVDYVEKSEDLSLYVIREDDNETIILHHISSDDIYRKQEDTIISWRDPEFSTEMALSFQETAGCSYIWEHICSVQRNLNFNTLNNGTFHGVNSELRELPAVQLSTLPLILKTVVESGIAYQMRLSELILNDQDFFRKLFDVFRICEDMESKDSLHMLFKIVRGIILLNNSHIFERLFRDELIMDVIGTLEYDPEVPNVQHHRSFLREHVVFKEAIPIKDRLALSKIHQTYRIGYVKDVIFSRAMDEATVSTLNSMIQSNNATVVTLLKDDNVFIQELFARCRSPTISIESKKNLIFFLHEFCTLSKSLQMVQQLRLSRDLINEGIFDIITDALQSPEKRLVLTGTDILILFLNQDPNLLRNYVVRPEGIPLLGLLVKGMLTDFGDDMHCQFLEILRSLLDSLTVSGSQGSQKESIVEIFYAKHLGELVDFITASCSMEKGDAQSFSKSVVSGRKVENQSIVKPEILLNICDLLCFCVLHHPYRIESNFLPCDVIERVLLLTKRKEKYLVVASVRFVRAIVSRQDEFLNAHIVKHNLLKPIVEAFVANGNRYNLLHSAVLELFDYVWKEKLKSLLKYLVQSFWGELVNFENLASVHSLRVKYDQSMDNSTTDSTINVLESRKRNDERGMDKEEEDYFNEDIDEEDTTSASLTKNRKVHDRPALSNDRTTIKPSTSLKSGGLVDYEDDEDDEDYRPPPKKQLESSDAEEGIVKRKLGFKDKNPELPKKQRPAFASLCSKLSQVVLPIKKTAITIQNVPPTQGGGELNSDEVNHGEVEAASDRNGSENVTNSADETLMEEEHAADKKRSNNTRSLPEENHMEAESAADRNSCVEIKNSAVDGHLEDEYPADKKGSDVTKSSAEEIHMDESATDRNSHDVNKN